MTQFVDKSLKPVEISLEMLLESSKKVDIKKSMYHPDNYNLLLTSEKDNSVTFMVHGVPFKQRSYAKLMSYCN